MSGGVTAYHHCKNSRAFRVNKCRIYLYHNFNSTIYLFIFINSEIQ